MKRKFTFIDCGALYCTECELVKNVFEETNTAKQLCRDCWIECLKKTCPDTEITLKLK